MPDITAAELSRRLIGRLARNGRVVMPNAYILGSPWESDVIVVTPRFYWDEYEIKLSIADYKADFRKKSNKYSTGVLKHEVYASDADVAHRKYGKFVTLPKPAHFTFVTPPGLLIGIELPAHCGLAEIDGRVMNWIKQPPRLRPATRLGGRVIFNLAMKAASRLMYEQRKHS